jgi:ferrous iron transport protein B
MLVAAFFPSDPTGAMFLVVLAAWFFVLVVSRLLRWTVVKGESTPFVMEIPIPSADFRGVLIHTWERVWQYIKKAGTVILAVSIVMWAVMTFPELPEDKSPPTTPSSGRRGPGQDRTSRRGRRGIGQPCPSPGPDHRRPERGGTAICPGGRIAAVLKPVTDLAGFPWQANIALIGAFAAKEVFVSTMATAYSMGEVDPEDAGSLSDRLAADPAWSLPAVLSVFVFMLLYTPCMVTVVAIAREAGWKWALFSVGAPWPSPSWSRFWSNHGTKLVV